MFKKKLTTLLHEEEKELLKNNSDLLEAVRESWIDSAAFWVEDYLHDCAGCDYSISYGLYSYGDYFRITDLEKALAWLQDNQETFCFLSDEEYKTVETLEKYSEIYNHVYELYHYGYSPYTGKYGLVADRDFNNVEKKYKELLHKVENAVFNRLRGEIDYWGDDQNVINDGLECWLMNNPDAENLYTDLKHIFFYTPPEIVPGKFIPAHYVRGYVVPEEIEIIM